VGAALTGGEDQGEAGCKVKAVDLAVTHGLPGHVLGLAPPPDPSDLRRGKHELEQLRAFEARHPGSYMERSEAAAAVEQAEFRDALRGRMHRPT
jgi:hypothetical protein